MRVAIMQPYVFPYLGYYQLLHAADRFVLLDDVNFIKKGWINRNRILLNGASHTFTIPVQDVSQNRTIKDHMTSADQGWKPKLLANLKHAYAKAPMFAEVFPALEELFTQAEGSIAGLAERSIRYVAERAGLPVNIHRSSDLSLDVGSKGQERILSICAKHGATRYINPANGAELYQAERFAAQGIELRFLRMNADLSYPQIGATEHVPALSAIDALMHCTPEELRALLGQYRLLGAAEIGAVNPSGPGMSTTSEVLSRQFVFIVGAPRSGTTWLHRMIAEHPQVASVDPELTWFSRYLPPALGNFEREKQHIDKGDWQQGLPILFTPEEFMHGLLDLTGIVYERVLRTRPTATHIVDKHPNYANHMGTIARMLPQAKFIHIIRDGRDVAASMISAARREHFGAAEARGAAEDWDRFTRSALRSGKEIGPQRYMEVRYEALMKDGGTLLGQLFSFMGLPADPAEAGAIVERNAFGRKTFSKADPGRTANPDQTWKERLDLHERYRFDRVAGPLLVELGYAQAGWWAAGPMDRLAIALSSPGIRLKRSLKAAWGAFRQEV